MNPVLIGALGGTLLKAGRVVLSHFPGSALTGPPISRSHAAIDILGGAVNGAALGLGIKLGGHIGGAHGLAMKVAGAGVGGLAGRSMAKTFTSKIVDMTENAAYHRRILSERAARHKHYGIDQMAGTKTKKDYAQTVSRTSSATGRISISLNGWLKR